MEDKRACTLQSMGLQRVGHDWVTNTFTFQFTKLMLYVFHWILTIFYMYYHLQFASETTEANLFAQGHPAELGFEPSSSKAEVLTTTHHLPPTPPNRLDEGTTIVGPGPPTPCLLLGWSALLFSQSAVVSVRASWLENSRRESALR